MAIIRRGRSSTVRSNRGTSSTIPLKVRLWTPKGAGRSVSTARSSSSMRTARSSIPLSKKINRVLLVKESRFERLHYATGFNRTTNGTTESSYAQAFRMHSIYDADVNNVAKNKSVAGYNQVSVLYKQYKVYAFKATVTFINKASTSAIVWVATADSAQWTGAFDTSQIGSDVITRPGIKYRILAPAGQKGDRATLRVNQMPRTALGLDKTQWNGDPTRGALIGASPSATDGKEPYFICGQSSLIDSSVAVSNIDYVVNLTYGTKLWDPIEDIDA